MPSQVYTWIWTSWWHLPVFILGNSLAVGNSIASVIILLCWLRVLSNNRGLGEILPTVRELFPWKRHMLDQTHPSSMGYYKTVATGQNWNPCWLMPAIIQDALSKLEYQLPKSGDTVRLFFVVKSHPQFIFTSFPLGRVLCRVMKFIERWTY